LAASALALLVWAPDALAIAGGGSSGFSGGGGGGGGGFSGGGGGFGGGGGGTGSSGGSWIVVVVILVLWFVVHFYMRRRTGRHSWPLALFSSFGRRVGQATPKKVAERARKVELAAAEAAEDDPAFAPDVVRPAAANLFIEIQKAWSAQDKQRLASLVGQDLLTEWGRRLRDFKRKGWRNEVEILDGPHVEYVGLRNVEDDRGDRVIVLIDATVRDYVIDGFGTPIRRVDATGDRQRVQEYWTLSKRRGQWILQSIEQGREGTHALSDEIVASPWSDEKTFHDQALIEEAVAEAAPSVAEVADLDYEGDARAAAMDLSLADGRFAPDVLEVGARRAVAAWAEAIDGADGALLAIAHPDVVREMLHPGDPSARTRVVVRGLEVKRITIVSLDAAATPPTMTIDVELTGRRYIEDRDTLARISGSQSHVTRFAERWMLALDGSAEQPWRIAAAGLAAGSVSARA